MSDETTAIGRLNHLRGIFALLIVLGHCSVRFEKELLPLMVIHKSDMVSVCFFFIISGWSLCYNWYRKENYLKGFFVKKILRLSGIAILCQLVSLILRFLVLGTKPVIDLGIITGMNWYIYEILFFYVVFLICFAIRWNRIVRLSAIWILSLLFSILMLYVTNRTVWAHSWHYSSLCFAFGITIHEFYDKVRLLIKKRIVLSAVLLVLCLASCICLKMPSGGFIGGCLLHNAVGIFAISILIVWAHFIDLKKIPLIGLLGKISLEIYLYQFTVLEIVTVLFVNSGHGIDLLFVGVSVLSTLAVAAVMYFPDKMISRLTSRIAR